VMARFSYYMGNNQPAVTTTASDQPLQVHASSDSAENILLL